MFSGDDNFNIEGTKEMNYSSPQFCYLCGSKLIWETSESQIFYNSSNGDKMIKVWYTLKCPTLLALPWYKRMLVNHYHPTASSYADGPEPVTESKEHKFDENKMDYPMEGV